ncbi:MAG: DNA polymerase III subunit epsilon [Gammaproteobacteria bacterium]
MALPKHDFKQRLVVLDTETTGLNPQEGHRIIEIGCVELINRRLTGNRFHVYINPDRLIDDGAIEVHGITNQFLEDKPRFHDVVGDLIDFIRDSELIIHNAPFDVGFLHHEFSLLDSNPGTISDFCEVFDTLTYARQKHPGQRNSLDALCKRYGVDNSHRDLHGALLDAEILAEVYLLMTGGQSSLLDEGDELAPRSKTSERRTLHANRPAIKIIHCNDEELEAHRQRLTAIEMIGGACLWKHE